MSLAAASYKHFVYPVMESFGLDGVTMGPSRPRGIDQKVGEAAAGAFAAAAAEAADEAEDALPDSYEELREMLAETERAIKAQNTLIAARKETLKPVSHAFMDLGHAIAAAADPTATARAAATARALADPELLKGEYIQSLVDAGLVDEDAARALHAVDIAELTDSENGILTQWRNEYQQLRLDIVPAMMHLKVQRTGIFEKMQEVSFPVTTPVTYGLTAGALRVVPDEASLLDGFLSGIVWALQPLLFDLGTLFIPKIFSIIDLMEPVAIAVDNFFIEILLAVATGLLISCLLGAVLFTTIFALIEFPVATVTAYVSVWICWLLTFVIEGCMQEVAIRDIPGMMPTPFDEPDETRKISAGDLKRFQQMCEEAGEGLHNVDTTDPGTIRRQIGHMLQAIYDETKDWVDIKKGSLKFVNDEKKANFKDIVLTLNEGLRKCEPTWWVVARECIQKLRGVEAGRESLASFALEHRKTVMRDAIGIGISYHDQDGIMVKHGKEFGFREEDFGEDPYRNDDLIIPHAEYVRIRDRFYRMLFNPDQFAEGVLAQMQLALNHGTDKYYRKVLTDYILQRHDNVLSRNMRPGLSEDAIEAEKLRRAELLVDRDFYDYAPATNDEGALVRESDGSLVLQPSLNALGAKALLVQEGFLADGNNPVVMDDDADDEE